VLLVSSAATCPHVLAPSHYFFALTLACVTLPLNSSLLTSAQESRDRANPILPGGAPQTWPARLSCRLSLYVVHGQTCPRISACDKSHPLDEALIRFCLPLDNKRPQSTVIHNASASVHTCLPACL